MAKRVKEAASVTFPAPENLAKWGRQSGFEIEITMTRTGEISEDAKDPGADPGPIDDPIEGKELEILRRLIGAYDARRADDE
jgi:hypothetical protein